VLAVMHPGQEAGGDEPMRVEPLEPRRVRYPRGAWGWVDLRIVTEGHLSLLDQGAALVYLFLCAVGNREGISFWSRDRMARTLKLPLEAVEAALRALVAADLIAATERVVQVLPVQARVVDQMAPPQTRTAVPRATEPVAPSPPHREPSEDELRAHEAQARAQIARFYGRREPSAGVVRALAKSLALKSKVST
jgi:hypothetical protein